jgi:hypothetical protein
MNELIKKLAEQAFRDTVLSGGKRDDKDFDQLYNERFAELIVRECAGIYEKIDNGNQHMGTDNYLEALHKTFRS